MAKQSRSNLENRALGVRTTQTLGANSALVIGQLFLDILSSVATEFDPDRVYNPGELAIWQGRTIKCFQTTIKGETPETAEAKWIDDTAKSSAEMDRHVPILASVVKAYVSERINEVNADGSSSTPLSKADEEMLNLGVNDSAYVTPKGLALLLGNVLRVLVNLDPPTLDSVAKSGTAQQIGKTSQLLQLLGGLVLGNIPTTSDTSFPTLVMDSDGKVWKRSGGGVVTTPPVISYRVKSLEQFVFIDDGVVVTPPPTAPSYRLRFDQNSCGTGGSGGTLSGWGVDVNNPNGSLTLDVFIDGTKLATIVANTPRQDVRDYLIGQGLIPAGTTFKNYGYVYDKPAQFQDGQIHAWEVKSPDGLVVATSDTGAQAVLTCGSPTPTIVQQLIAGMIDFPEGSSATVSVNNRYSNGSYTPYIGPGTFSIQAPYPNGVTITNTGNATATIAIPADSITADVDCLLLFTFDDGRVINQPIKFRNVASTPAPRYQIMIDENSCGSSGSNGIVRGWALDLNNPNQSITLELRVDGQHLTNKATDEQRDDVRQYLIGQGAIPGTSTFNAYGFRFFKPPGYADGQNHNWQVVSADGVSVASSGITCSAVVTDPSANPPVLTDSITWHSYDFTYASGTNPADWPIGFIAFGGGQFDFQAGEVCQVADAMTQAELVYTTNDSQTSLNKTYALAEARVNAFNSGYTQVGPGLRHHTDGSGGINFVILNPTSVGFHIDNTAFGPGLAYNTEVGVLYWMKMIYQETGINTAKVSARIWKAGEPEPLTWMLEWTGIARRDGYPAWNGGYGSARACCSFLLDGIYVTD